MSESKKGEGGGFSLSERQLALASSRRGRKIISLAIFGIFMCLALFGLLVMRKAPARVDEVFGGVSTRSGELGLANLAQQGEMAERRRRMAELQALEEELAGLNDVVARLEQSALASQREAELGRGAVERERVRNIQNRQRALQGMGESAASGVAAGLPDGDFHGGGQVEFVPAAQDGVHRRMHSRMLDVDRPEGWRGSRRTSVIRPEVKANCHRIEAGRQINARAAARVSAGGGSTSAVIAVVGYPVLDQSFRHVVFPAGTAFLGWSSEEPSIERPRLVAEVDQAWFPDGRSVQVEARAVGTLGDDGLDVDVNHRWDRRFGGGLLSGAVFALSQIGSRENDSAEASEIFVSSTSREFDTATRPLARRMSEVPSEFTLGPGEHVGVLLSGPLEVCW